MSTPNRAIAPVTNANKPLGEAEKWTLYKQQVAPDCPTDTFMLFIEYCRAKKLDPILHQIHLVNYGGKWVYQVSIDGLVDLAARTGEYAGLDPITYEENAPRGQYPVSAIATVYRFVNGVRCPFSHTAYWEEYARKYKGQLGNMWQSMPRNQLGKCALAGALRRTFRLGGLYIQEEMDQARANAVEAQAVDAVTIAPLDKKAIAAEVAAEASAGFVMVKHNGEGVAPDIVLEYESEPTFPPDKKKWADYCRERAERLGIKGDEYKQFALGAVGHMAGAKWNDNDWRLLSAHLTTLERAASAPVVAEAIVTEETPAPTQASEAQEAVPQATPF